MKNREWTARWIRGSVKYGMMQGVSPAPYLRKKFNIEKRPVEATAYLCGLGWHELYINGIKADDRVLAPVITQYDRHAAYTEYDLAGLLKEGSNSVVVLLGNGTYNCHTPGPGVYSIQYSSWRDLPKLLFELEADGKTILKSDDMWKTHASPIIFDAMREGEYYDARMEIPGVFEPDFDDSAWEMVSFALPPGGILIEDSVEPCKISKTYRPVKKTVLSSLVTIYDFGTNLTGWCKISVSGNPGSLVVIQYGEIERDNGDLDRAYLDYVAKEGHSFQEDRYTLKGNGIEIWHPRFTYHGFRYAKLIMSDPSLKIHEVEAQFIHTAFEEIGCFESSDTMLNRLQEITIQSYLCNFTGIPTDCPHREKNGWTGDAQLAMETGLWNFNSAAGYANFEQILVDCQRPNGQLPTHVPTSLWGYESASLPYDFFLFEAMEKVWLFTGNDTLIRQYYDAAEKYIGFCESMADGHLVSFGLGDWSHVDSTRMAPVELTSSAYYFLAVSRMAQFSKYLNKLRQSRFYASLANRIKQQIVEKYCGADGVYSENECTALALLAAFGIADGKSRSATVEKLVSKVRSKGHRADFGILGAKWVPRVLAENGYADDALRLITQPEYPGWGNWVGRGATTLWECWNGTESRNHIMFGDISAWMYQYAAGIMPLADSPGFKHFRIKPCFISGLNWIKACHRSPFGWIQSEWKRTGNEIEFKVSIPEKSTADVDCGNRIARNISGENIFRIKTVTGRTK